MKRRFVVIAAATFILGFSANAYAGMIIEKNTIPDSKAANGFVVEHSKIRPIHNHRILNGSSSSSSDLNFSNIVSAKSLAKVGPAGYGRFVSPSVLLKQVSPKKEMWTLSCPDNICTGKTLTWASDGSILWKDLYYQTISKVDKDLNVRFNTSSKEVSIGYPDNHVMNWVVNKDRTLKENMKKWASDAGWKLDWDMPSSYDWETGTTFAIHGTYKDALNKIFRAYSSKGVFLEAIYYKNRVVQIVNHVSRKSF